MVSDISVSIEARVAHVVLDRPGRKNAISWSMFPALATAADELAANRAVRAVVLSGAGGNFSAGIDTAVFDSVTADDLARTLAPAGDSAANVFQRAATAWRDLPVPVICAIEGVAFGAGLQIALGADIRYAARDARFSIMEVRWGLIPDMGISVTARNVLAGDNLKELAYTGRVIDAGEAAGIGLVTSIHDDPVAAALALAQEVAARSPSAIRAMKQLFDEGLNAPVAVSLALEAELQAGLIGKPDQVEAVRANMEKRSPNFRDIDAK